MLAGPMLRHVIFLIHYGGTAATSIGFSVLPAPRLPRPPGGWAVEDDKLKVISDTATTAVSVGRIMARVLRQENEMKLGCGMANLASHCLYCVLTRQTAM